jgi:hypothetical protein
MPCLIVLAGLGVVLGPAVITWPVSKRAKVSRGGSPAVFAKIHFPAWALV